MSEWFSLISAISKDGFSRVKNIFICPSSGQKTHLNQPVKGQTSPAVGGFYLYPDALNGETDKSTQISMLTRLMTHEYFHQYMMTPGVTKLFRDWMEVSGKSLHYKYPERIDGKEEVSTRPEVAESKYGDGFSIEEFCDSGAKAIYNRTGFSLPAKRKFIDSHLIDISRLHMRRTRE